MRFLTGSLNPKVHLTELTEITISRALHGLTNAMVGIFIPIYLYELGYSLTLILTFYSIYFFGKAVSHYPATKLIARIGPKHGLVLAYSLNIIYYIGLYMLSVYSDIWLLGALGFFTGIYGSVLLISSHLDLSSAMGKKLGKDLATFQIIVALTVAMGPFTGGLIAAVYGAESIYMFALLVLLFAMIPLFLTKEPFQKVEINFKKLNMKRLLVQAPHQIEYNIGSVVLSSLWPLYMALFIFADNPYAAVGFVTTVAIFAKVLETYTLGKLIDKGYVVKILRTSSFLSAIIHIMRAFILHPVYVIFFNIISELGHKSNIMSYADEFYVALNHKDKIEHLIGIEIIADASKLLFFSTLIGASVLVSDQATLALSFFIAGGAYLVMSLTANKIKELT